SDITPGARVALRGASSKHCHIGRRAEPGPKREGSAMITLVSSTDVFRTARTVLHLPSGDDPDDAYWIATLRRLAGYHCPCSPRTLIASVIESHRNLVDINDAFIEQIERLIDTL